MWGTRHSTKVLFHYASGVRIHIRRPMSEVHKAQRREPTLGGMQDSLPGCFIQLAMQGDSCEEE